LNQQFGEGWNTKEKGSDKGTKKRTCLEREGIKDLTLKKRAMERRSQTGPPEDKQSLRRKRLWPTVSDEEKGVMFCPWRV